MRKIAAMTSTMLAVLDDIDKGASFLRTALARAERTDARLIVQLLTPSPLVLPSLAPLSTLYLPIESLEETSDEQIARLRHQLGDRAGKVELRGLFDDAAWLAGDVRKARTIADIAMIGAHETWAVPYLYRRVAETLALGSSAPLVILPPGRSLASVTHAVFAWKPCPEAIRALRDLVALLEPAARVDIVSCGDQPAQDSDPKGHAAVVAYLEQLGMNAESVWRPRQRNVAEQLQTFALEAGADLLAAGAFAHGRMRELVFGGVTEGLIASAHVPVLLSR